MVRDDTVVLLLGLLAVSLVSLKFLQANRRHRGDAQDLKSVTIIVLGDIGRSPRMLYHATSFMQRGYKIYIVAYPGSTPSKLLLESPHVTFVYLPTPMAFVSKLPRPLFLLLSPLKVIAGAAALFWALVYRIGVTPEFTLIQNPPSIPTLPVVKFANLLCRSKIIIDWHNTGYSVLSLRLGAHSPVVRFAKAIEIGFGRSAYAHLCVTEAMRQSLIREVRLEGKVVVLHDRPPSHFRRQNPAEVHQVSGRCFAELGFCAPDWSSLQLLAQLPNFTGDSSISSDLFTDQYTEDGSHTLAKDRPALLVSATSWTADEDFSILLDALDQYNKAANALGAGLVGKSSSLPAIVVIITGKGAGKAAFEAQVTKLEAAWKWVRVRTAWLPLEDYPKLLGSADLGISLHTSTSGADLPMKVVDMFGCQLPVCALDFACVDELVQDGVNGHTFKTADDLSYLLMTLLRDFPHDMTTLDRLRRGITEAEYPAAAVHRTKGGADEGDSDGRCAGSWSTWDENWTRVVVDSGLCP